MHIKSTVLCLTSVALIGSAVASPSVLRVTGPKTSKRQVLEITGEVGCQAKGPLAGPWAVELFTCTTDSNYTCQATDATGCTTGDPNGIESLMVLDSTTGQPLSGAASIAEAYFKCPANGLVQCAVQFANNGSSASSYALRITNATGTIPFSNATFGAPTDSASNSTSNLSSTPTANSTDSLSGFGSTPTDSGFGASATDSGFGSSTPSDSGFGSSPTDSLGGSSSVGGFGSTPTGTNSGFGTSPSGSGSGFGSSSTDTSGSNPSSGAFGSQVLGNTSGSPVATSSSSSTSSSGFGSVPSSALSGFSKI